MKYILLLLTGVLSFVDLSAQHGTAVEPVLVRHPDKHVAIEVPSLPVSHGFSLRHKGPVSGFLDSKKIYSSAVKDHHLYGSWQSWYVNGRRLDSGALQQGVPDGEWKRWDSAGNLLAIRHYDAVKLQRICEEIRLRHSRRRFYALTALYEKSRPATQWYLSAAGSFSSPHTDKPGLQKLTENNSQGKSYHPVFETCLHHGLYMNFYSNGNVKDSGYYKDGLPDGLWLHANAEGLTWQGAYKNGLRAQEWKQYDKNGQLILMIFYNRRGEEVGRKEIKRNAQ